MAEKEATTEPAEGTEHTDNGDSEHAGVVLHERPDSILQPARYGFDPAQVKAIRQTVAKDCTDAELVMFLEVCGRYELDPFAKQIFAAKIQGGVQIIVSRDGLLALAHRSPDFEGLIGDVICEGDEFAVSYEAGKRNVQHRYTLTKPDPATSESPDDDGRGKIVGAWAEVRRKGHEPTFFFAPLSEYDRGGKTPWTSHKSSMILKVAEVYALRKAFTVSGVVGEEEIDRRANLTALPEEPDYGEGELAEELREALKEAREIDPTRWRPAKVKALLDGQTDEGRRALLVELDEFIDKHAANEVVDAEVVSTED